MSVEPPHSNRAPGHEVPPAPLTLVQVKRRRTVETKRKRGDLTDALIVGAALAAEPAAIEPEPLFVAPQAPLMEAVPLPVTSAEAAPVGDDISVSLPVEPEPSAPAAEEAPSYTVAFRPLQQSEFELHMAAAHEPPPAEIEPEPLAATPPTAPEPFFPEPLVSAPAEPEPEPVTGPEPWFAAAAPPAPEVTPEPSFAPLAPPEPAADAVPEPSSFEPSAPEPPSAVEPVPVPVRKGPRNADDLIDYWDELRGTRTLPSLNEIDRPLIAACWANSLILAFGETEPVMPRITRLGETNGEIEFTPMVIDWMMSRGKQCARRGAPMEEEQRFPVSQGSARYKLLLLPLSSFGIKSDCVLCLLSRAQELSVTAAFRRWLAS